MLLSLSGCGLALKDGTKGSTEVRDNASSEPVFVYISRDKAAIQSVQS